LLELGLEVQEFFCHIEMQFLSGDGIRQFLKELAFDDLTEEIWLKIVGKLTAQESEQCNRPRHRMCFCSTIVRTIPPVLKEFSGAQWALLYRGSRDGFAAAHFHGKCDGQSNTLTLIETTKGFVFCGFTPVAWETSGGTYKPDSTQTSFLFTVKNPQGTEGRKFPLASSSNAIRCQSDYGPVFGSNYDLKVVDGCNTSTGNYTNLGGAYRNDTGLDGKQVFTGEYNFSVKEIEVFAIRV
jgi:hypothetical protein